MSLVRLPWPADPNIYNLPYTCVPKKESFVGGLATYNCVVLHTEKW